MLSETLLYSVRVVEELEAALSCLNQQAESINIVDRPSIFETRGMISESVTVILHLLRLVQLALLQTEVSRSRSSLVCPHPAQL